MWCFDRINLVFQMICRSPLGRGETFSHAHLVSSWLQYYYISIVLKQCKDLCFYKLTIPNFGLLKKLKKCLSGRKLDTVMIDLSSISCVCLGLAIQNHSWISDEEAWRRFPETNKNSIIAFLAAARRLQNPPLTCHLCPRSDGPGPLAGLGPHRGGRHVRTAPLGLKAVGRIRRDQSAAVTSLPAGPPSPSHPSRGRPVVCKVGGTSEKLWSIIVFHSFILSSLFS